ncbi:hypothetical protein AAFF_G00252130 [Aldrovandia affinis]|uniref:Uncharacterized protein n=1 Tax=Aldrovandia affinis TaxID=143900 RepID=A0AAD7STV2_9TELE|nr:hypothetical protein AAFF_G00252130 [Aldrovandia affinis]
MDGASFCQKLQVLQITDDGSGSRADRALLAQTAAQHPVWPRTRLSRLADTAREINQRAPSRSQHQNFRPSLAARLVTAMPLSQDCWTLSLTSRPFTDAATCHQNRDTRVEMESTTECNVLAIPLPHRRAAMYSQAERK